MTARRDEQRAGVRDEYTSPIGAANSGAGGGSSTFGNMVGTISEGLGAANNTGAFISAGMPFTKPAGLTDFVIDYVLFISSSAGATGGLNLSLTSTGGGFRIFTAFGNAGSLTAFRSQNTGNSNAGPYCTFDCSALIAGLVGPGWIQVRAIVVGANAAGLTFDLQFQNVVGAETYSVTATSYAILTKINK